MSQTAERYAKMFYELARKEGNLEDVHEAMSAISGLLDLRDFKLFVANPLLSFEEQARVLRALFEGRVPEPVFLFLLFIAHKRRLGLLGPVMDAFEGLYMSGKGQLKALVTTAMPLNETDQDLINQRLADKFHRQMITQWKRDPALIGGFRIFVQGQIFDYSFKNQLNQYFYRSLQPA